MRDEQKSRASWGVVMPFYNNQATIDACLRSFLDQSLVPNEIVVVDDGSLSQVELQALRERWPAPVRIESRPHGGQSVCTNHAIRLAKSDFLLLTCADIIAPRNLMRLHRDGHADRSDDVAVIGPLPYARSVPMTPFMHYLCLPGVQFCFHEMTDFENVNPMHCYAPNVSVARSRLMDIGLFDETFPFGLQDTDLGYRLGQSGVRFVLQPKAYAFHARGTNLQDYLRRQRRVGQGLVRWLEKYPTHKNMAAQLVGALRVALLHKLSFEALVDKAEKDYAPYDSPDSLTKETYIELFTTFGRLLAVAAGLGIVEQHQRLRALLQSCEALRGEDMPIIQLDEVCDAVAESNVAYP